MNPPGSEGHEVCIATSTEHNFHLETAIDDAVNNQVMKGSSEDAANNHIMNDFTQNASITTATVKVANDKLNEDTSMNTGESTTKSTECSSANLDVSLLYSSEEPLN